MDWKIFQSKKEVLEYLGKSPKDTRLIDRMISRGEVVRLEDGWYGLVEKVSGDELEKLRAENEELKQKVADLELDKEIRESNEVSMEDLKEATAQWHYYEEEYENEKKDKENRIRKCFQRIKARNPKANWEEFRDWVMSNDE